MHTVKSAALLVGVLAAAGCGSVHRLAASPTSTPTGAGATATVTGHVSWPDCSGGAACPGVDGIAVHFADAAGRRTFTAVSDGSGRYTIQLPPGSYQVIAGDADRSPYQRPVAVRPGDSIELDLRISLPTGG